jgi:hypothetical protein
MTLTTYTDQPAASVIRAKLPQAFSGGWNRLDGVTVDGDELTIDTARYFYRYQNPTWMLCDWVSVRRDLLGVAETPESALEQVVLDYVRANGRRTTDPAEVLTTAWHVYAFLFRDEQLADPGLARVAPRYLPMLREMGTVMALNRVELDGTITNVGPAWFFADVAQVVFSLSVEECVELDELYHGGFFNERRRVESVKAHAALGGRLVHGCQSAPDLSGGVVAPYGMDVTRFADELGRFKSGWRAAIHAQRTQR